jgi:hypothetical protein
MKQIIISLDQETVVALNKNNWTLCCFLGCQSDNSTGGAPLCWNVTKFFLNSVQIKWENDLCAYISTSPINNYSQIYIPQPFNQKEAKTSIVTTSIFKIKQQERMLIDENYEIKIDSDNIQDNVLIKNNSNIGFSSGICVGDNLNEYCGICALSLFGNNSIRVAPNGKVFVMFSAKDIQVNMAVFKSENKGMLIDLNGASNDTRIVEYSINKGWSADGSTWATKYTDGTNLQELMITHE